MIHRETPTSSKKKKKSSGGGGSSSSGSSSVTAITGSGSYGGGHGGKYGSSPTPSYPSAVGGGSEVAATSKAAKRAEKAARRRRRSERAGVVSTSERRKASSSTRKNATKRDRKKVRRNIGIAEAFRGQKTPTTKAERRAAARGDAIRNIYKTTPQAPTSSSSQLKGISIDAIRANALRVTQQHRRELQQDLKQKPKGTEFVAGQVGPKVAPKKVKAEIAKDTYTVKRLKLQQVRSAKNSVRRNKAHIQKKFKDNPKYNQHKVKKVLEKQDKVLRQLDHKGTSLEQKVDIARQESIKRNKAFVRGSKQAYDSLEQIVGDAGDVEYDAIFKEAGIRARGKPGSRGIEVKVPGGQWQDFELAKASGEFEDSLELASYISLLRAPAAIGRLIAIPVRALSEGTPVLGRALRGIRAIPGPLRAGGRFIGAPSRVLGHETFRVGGKIVSLSASAARRAGVGKFAAKLATSAVVRVGGRVASFRAGSRAARTAADVVDTRTGATMVRNATLEDARGGAQGLADGVADAIDAGIMGMAEGAAKTIPAISGYGVAARTIGAKAAKGLALTGAFAGVPQVALGDSPQQAASDIMRNAYDLIVSVVPSTYETAAATVEAIGGDWSRAEKLKDEFFQYSALGLSLKGDWEGALKAYDERPFTTMLEVAGVEYVAGRVFGAGLRTFGTEGMKSYAGLSDIRGIGPVQTRAHEIGRFSPDIFRKRATIAARRLTPERSKARAAQEMTHRRVDREVAIVHAKRLRMADVTNREFMDMKKEAEGIAQSHHDPRSEGKPVDEAGSNALPFMVARIARNPDTAAADLLRYKTKLEEQIKGDRNEASHAPYTQATIDIIDSILEHSEFLKDQRLWDIADRFTAAEKQRQSDLVRSSTLDDHQASAAAWVPYITEHMGAVPEADSTIWKIDPIRDAKGRFVKQELDLSKPADLQIIRDHAARENVAEPGFISLQGLDKDHTIPQSIQPKGKAAAFHHRTGESVVLGTFDPTFNSLYSHAMRVNNIVMDADHMIRIATLFNPFTRNAKGEVLYHGTNGDAHAQILEDGFNTDEVWFGNRGTADQYSAGPDGKTLASDIDTRDFIKVEQNQNGKLTILTEGADFPGIKPNMMRVDDITRNEMLSRGFKGIEISYYHGGKEVIVLDKSTIGNIREPNPGVPPEVARERLQSDETASRVQEGIDVRIEQMIPFLREAKGEPGITIENSYFNGTEVPNSPTVVYRDENGDPIGILDIHYANRFRMADGRDLSFDEYIDEPSDLSVSSYVDTNHLDSVELAVDPEHRRQGIATAMIKAAYDAGIPIHELGNNSFSPMGAGVREGLLNKAEELLGVKPDEATHEFSTGQQLQDTRKVVQKEIDKRVKAGEFGKDDYKVINMEVLLQRQAASKGIGEDLDTGSAGRQRYDSTTSAGMADAMDEAQRGHFTGNPQWVALPTAVIKRLHEHAKVDDFFYRNQAGRMIRHFNRTFKGAVLPFNPRWGLGNVMDMTYRMMMDQGTPVQWAINWARGKKLLKKIRDHSEDAYWEMMESIGHGFMTEATQSILEDRFLNAESKRAITEKHQIQEDMQGWMSNPQDRGWMVQRAIAISRGMPGFADKAYRTGKVGGRAYNALQEWNPAGFRGQRWIEKQVRTAAVGKADKQLLGELQSKWEEATLITPNVIEDTTLRLKNSNVISALAERVNGVLGDYSRMSPAMRRAVMSYAPFALWMRASITWVLTLPAKHPAATAMVSSLEGMTEKDRAEIGLSVLHPVIKGKQQALKGQTPTAPPFALGSIPGIGGGQMPTQTLSSFGTLYDPSPIGATDFLIPQMSSSVFGTAMGVSWTGEELVYPDGSKPNVFDKTGIALSLLTETFFPAARWWKIYKAEGNPDETATFFDPKPQGLRDTYVSPYQDAPRYEEGKKDVLGELFNPVRAYSKPDPGESTKLPPAIYGDAAAAAGTAERKKRKDFRKSGNPNGWYGNETSPKNKSTGGWFD